jgi:hypothetical protein
MRIMVKFALPVEAGNAALRSGKLQAVMQKLVEDIKPEASYFYPDGVRAGFFVVDMSDSSQIAATVERFFFGLNADVELVPVMNADDLHKALAGIQDTIKRFG